ncbi:sulfotransferase domain-containing protein [Solwaraspora sp. WMMD406]|uniref:sulfotransferase n=1 Tax=Solwaraspora sp. WMMD406 TaxID=3016095 RepID=UPI0024163F1D|nr:sulfotransferase [Solwaraspora sp. WMMD406]MDG4767154.1 sulfotransferase domain-containing protein [Solwaraspora sp. WMMD406]
MTKVLFIAAWGRSGTTVLDNILNSHESVFSVGELTYIWSRGLRQRRPCGCGAPFPECPLWQQILRVAYDDDPPSAAEVSALQRRSLRIRHTPTILRTRNNPDVERYRGLIGRLYRAVADVTGATLIVDSSKSPADAALLSGVDGVEPYLLHVVRDPRAVAFSWSRPTSHHDASTPGLTHRHGPVDSSVSWLGWNLLIEGTARTYPRRHRRLRYEDFLAEPRNTVEELLRFVGLPDSVGSAPASDPFAGPFADQRTVSLRPNHTVSGNPSRFRTGEVSLRRDDRWLDQQDRRQRLISTLVSLPLLPRYRYPLWPGPR